MLSRYNYFSREWGFRDTCADGDLHISLLIPLIPNPSPDGRREPDLSPRPLGEGRVRALSPENPLEFPEFLCYKLITILFEGK
jgi:hypothetical protein